jgi:ADP-heptose:LPS heptosyltransferase
LGDAAATLPLLLELGKYFKVTVLTSRYNDSFLNRFVATRVFSEKPADFMSAVKVIFKNAFFVFHKRNERPAEYDLLLDLNGLRELDIFLRIRENNLCRHYAGFNMGIWNRLLDYASSKYPVLFSREPIINSCKELVKGALGVNLEIDDYIDFSAVASRPLGFDIEDFILVNISGAREFRGPSVYFFAELLDSLSSRARYVIMDELARPNLDEFKRHVKNTDIVYLKRDFSIWELLYIASKSRLYIGSDSGISNLLQANTNALLFYATGVPWVWRPYSKNPYEKKKVNNMTVETSRNSRGLLKKIIYTAAWCRPCFDAGCRNFNCVRGIDIEGVCGEINSILAAA